MLVMVNVNVLPLKSMEINYFQMVIPECVEVDPLTLTRNLVQSG